MNSILLYTKKVNAVAKDGKRKISFEKYLMSYKGKKYDVIITNDLKPRLEEDMKKQGLQFPIKMLLDKSKEHNDYFTKHETFIRNDQSKGDKDVVVIQDYRELSQGEFDNPKTLDDLD